MSFSSSQKKYINFALIMSFLTVNLSGCIDLSAAKYHPEKKTSYDARVEATTSNAHREYEGEVHTMLGGLGVFSTGMKELSSSVERVYHIPAPSEMWYNAGNVVRAVETYYRSHPNHHHPIILVGHSLGANEQIAVARQLNRKGISVDLLVTVDAVSRIYVPANVKYVMNFYKPGIVPMFSGLRLKAEAPEKTTIDNINVNNLKGIRVNHFTIDKEPVVQAMIMDKIKKVTRNAKSVKHI